jgi:phospholipase A1/A2
MLVRLCFLISCFVLMNTTLWANTSPSAIEAALMACKSQYADNTQADARLSCYDAIAVPVDAVVTLKTEPTEQVDRANCSKKGCGYLDRKWRLSSGESHDIADLETHKLNYLTVTNTTNTNDATTSPKYTTPVDRDLDNKDLKFQVSFKTELMRSIPFVRDFPRVETSRVWAAYTQQSHWQIFDSKNSRPMREHNFAPELILSLGLDNRENGERVFYRPRMLNIGAIHESNGRSQPISRSWNRIYVESGFELSDNVSLSVRPWWRIPESDSNDDNSDIYKYLGYGDVNLHWDNMLKNIDANFLLRNNLRGDNKGYAKLDIQYQPFAQENVKLHLMFSSGYGDSLVDYNHSQSVIGIGLSLGE